MAGPGGGPPRRRYVIWLLTWKNTNSLEATQSLVRVVKLASVDTYVVTRISPNGGLPLTPS
jgi:hypothetical protein